MPQGSRHNWGQQENITEERIYTCIEFFSHVEISR